MTPRYAVADFKRAQGVNPYPNEPAGFTPWFDHDWQDWPPGSDENTSYAASDAGFFNRWDNIQYQNLCDLSGNTGHYDLVTDSGPHGFGNAIRVKYENGHPAGSSIGCNIAFCSDGGVLDGDWLMTDHTDIERIYISYWYLWESGFYGAWTWWRHFSTNRHVNEDVTCTVENLIGCRQSATNLDGDGRIIDDLNDSRYWYRETCSDGNIGPASTNPVPTGQWVHYEHLWDCTGCTGGLEDDGPITVKKWIDGVLEIDTSFDPIMVRQLPGVRQVMFNANPSGGAAPTFDSFFRMTGMYISGVAA